MFISNLSIVTGVEWRCQLIIYHIFVYCMLCMFFIHCGADSVADIPWYKREQHTSLKHHPSSPSFPCRTYSRHRHSPDMTLHLLSCIHHNPSTLTKESFNGSPSFSANVLSLLCLDTEGAGTSLGEE